MKKLNQEIGKRIKILRLTKELNQEQIAAKLDITAGAFAKIERGETDASISRLYQIAAVLRVDIFALLIDNYKKKDVSTDESGVTDLLAQVKQLSKDMQKVKTEMAVSNLSARKKK
ncbi:MAG: helix-turn-helix transcriptional regulator [Bacteroidota bacterium]